MNTVMKSFMETNDMSDRCRYYMHKFCEEIKERAVGSDGNRMSTRFFKEEMEHLGWETEATALDAMDWHSEGASLSVGNSSFKVFSSPYSKGCNITAAIIGASSVEGLEKTDARGKILFLYGAIAREQLMPKNFVFYNPDEHKKIVSLLESSGAKAIISATGRNAALAGGAYPFPLIEDGDFEIPSVFMTEEEGLTLLPFLGKEMTLISLAERVSGKAYNVIARKNMDKKERIVISAHIDAKKNSPGAIDNATGVTLLLLLAAKLSGYSGDKQLEMVAFNGEDYYGVPGQMDYVMKNNGRFDEIYLNINIDGAGYHVGRSSLSFFNLTDTIKETANEIIAQNECVVEGPQWPQGDHSIFVQFGRPALAVSSEWFVNNIEDQDITHTPNDNLSIVDTDKLIDLAGVLTSFIVKL